MTNYRLSEVGLMVQATQLTAIWAMEFEIWTGAKPSEQQQREFWQARLDSLRGYAVIDAEPVRLALPEGTKHEE